MKEVLLLFINDEGKSYIFAMKFRMQSFFCFLKELANHPFADYTYSIVNFDLHDTSKKEIEIKVLNIVIEFVLLVIH